MKPFFLLFTFFFPSYILSQNPNNDLESNSRIKMDFEKIKMTTIKESSAAEKNDLVEISRNTTFRSISTSSEVGETSGNFAVSRSGAASYSIPIKIPSGVKDVAPNILLEYSSQASNSIAGYGWNISGISTITRVPSTKFHEDDVDGVDFDLKDRFALDGQRLILKSGEYGKSGSEYVTENYSNIRVRAMGTSPYDENYGPSYFIVNYPDGSMAYYGKYGSSRSRLEWSIGQWRNPQGLSVNYNYKTSGNLLRLSTIKYGKRNSTRGIHEIRFNYKIRTRQEQVYIGDVSFRRKYLLDNIQIYTNNSFRKKYKLNHSTTSLGYDRLNSVKEFNSNNQALNPIEFTYDDTSDSINSYQSTAQSFYPGFTYQDYELVGGDFNGDGKSDYLTYEKNDKTKLHLFTDMLTNDLSVGWQVNSLDFDQIVAGSFLTNNNKLLQQQGITTIKQKQLSSNSLTTQVKFYTFAMAPSGPVFQQEKIWNAPAYRDEDCDESSYKKIPRRFISGDFNADGLTDVIAINENYLKSNCIIDCDDPQRPQLDDCCQCTTTSYNSPKATFIDLNRFKSTNFINYAGVLHHPIQSRDSVFAADVDGDGKVDLVHIREKQINVYSYSLTTSRLELIMTTGTDSVIDLNMPIKSGDFNGDGKLDFVIPTAVDSNVWKFYLSKGSSFDSYTKNIGLKYQINGGSSLTRLEYHYTFQDFNGDGKTDILAHAVMLSLGHSTDIIQLYQNNYSPSLSSPTFTKSTQKVVQGTGVSRYGMPMPVQLNSRTNNPIYAYISVNKILSYEFTKSNVKDVTLRKISNSNGVETTINYANLAKDYNYNPPYISNDEEQYPYRNINVAPSFFVVSDIKETAAGQTKFQEYKYMGGVSHALGLGFLGFKGFAQSNWNNNVGKLFTTTIYSPQYRGAPLKQHVASWPNFNFDGTGNYISKTENSYDFELLQNKVIKNRLLSSISYDNLKQVETTVEYTYNEYLSPIKVKTLHPNGYNQVEYTYRNNITSGGNTYHVGRPLTKKETRSLNGEIISKEEQYIYANNIVREIKLRGHNTPFIVKEMSHDVYGNIIALETSAQGEATQNEEFNYDPSGRFLIRHRGIDGLVNQFEYDVTTGLLKKKTDPNGNTIQFTYDAWGRPFIETDYLGNTTLYTYNRIANNRYTIQKMASGKVSEKTTFDDLNRVVIESADSGMGTDWISKNYEYDILDRAVKTSEPYFSNQSPTQWNETQYDDYGRMISQNLFNGKTINTTYHQLTATVNDGTKTVTTTTDAVGNIVSMTDPGGTIHYTYFPDGNMKTANYDGHIVSIQQDGWGRKTKLHDPAAGTYNYVYNAWGQTIHETTPKGEISYDYDNHGRLIYKEFHGDNTNQETYYNYNQLGQLKLIMSSNFENDKDFEYTYTYDNYGRITQVEEESGDFNYKKTSTYDSYGRVATTNYFTSLSQEENTIQTKNSYFSNGSLSEIKNGQSNETLWKLNSINAKSQITSYGNGNAKVTTTNYDQYGFPVSIQHDDLFTLSYRFDTQRGNLGERQNSLFNEDERFGYDQLDRLTSIQSDSGINHTKQYDNRGRITQDSNLGELLFQSNSVYKLESIDLNNKGFAHYKDRKLQEITYNADKKPLSIFEKDKGRVDFYYGAFGQRTEAFYGGLQTDKTQRRYHKRYSHDGAIEIVNDKQAGSRKYITYIGGDAYSAPLTHIAFKGANTGFQSDFYYLHRNYQGSILGISNSQGNLVEKRHFGAWGELMHYDSDDVSIEDIQDGTAHFALLDRGYTGHEHFFSVGLIHMNGRMYDAKLGRFLSPDNYIQDPFNTQNFNRFGYGYNNPLKFTDPSGEFFVAALIGAVVSVIVNGVANIINDRPFFKGWGKAAIFGAIGGAASFGVGQIAAAMTASGASTLGVAAFQAVAHGYVGGFLSVAQGGEFLHGLIGGAVASSISTGIMQAFSNTAISQTMKDVVTIVGGGLGGGVSSAIAGGDFWQGFGYGVLAAGLNHVVHSGMLGEGLAIAAITGRVRHIFGPDALVIAGTGDVSSLVAAGVEKGGLIVLRGKEAGIYNINDLGVGFGGAAATLGVEGMNLYTTAKHVLKKHFYGARIEGNIGLSGLVAGAGASFVYSKENGYTTFGYGISFSVGPQFYINGNVNYGASSERLSGLPSALKKAYGIK